jgi:thioredoxin-like negative regulator of GroEL
MDPEARPTRLEDGAALDAFVDGHDPALVAFYTSGCSMCAAMEPVLGNVARATDVAVGMVNPGDDVALVERFDVRSVPTLILFRDGEERARVADGFRTTDAVVSFLGRHAPEPTGTAR